MYFYDWKEIETKSSNIEISPKFIWQIMERNEIRDTKNILTIIMGWLVATHYTFRQIKTCSVT